VGSSALREDDVGSSALREDDVGSSALREDDVGESVRAQNPMRAPALNVDNRGAELDVLLPCACITKSNISVTYSSASRETL